MFVLRDLLFSVLHFIDHFLYFCPFSIDHHIVCSSSTYGFWLHIWHLQVFLDCLYYKVDWLCYFLDNYFFSLESSIFYLVDFITKSVKIIREFSETIEQFLLLIYKSCLGFNILYPIEITWRTGGYIHLYKYDIIDELCGRKKRSAYIMQS